MRKKKLFIRSTATIVQQTNVQTTKSILKQLSLGESLDINPGSSSRSFDFDDQTKVDFDQDFFVESSNLMHQAMRRQEFIDHLKPTPPDSPADLPPADPPIADSHPADPPSDPA